MTPSVPAQKVLEMSTAHGAVLEVLRHFGHEVVGNDFANMLSGSDTAVSSVLRPVNHADPGRKTDDYGNAVDLENSEDVIWPYRNIIESVGIPMRIFDAGKTPYPADDKEFDVTICLQAIEHYCHADDWMVIVDEFCRITKGTIVILLNPPDRAAILDEGDYMIAFNQARMNLRRYASNGFRCVHSSIWFGQALGFKLMAV
ncbi:MAG: class I SAM-dependent methyltransferase [Silicimonas sp.]|nr:class I SAM-dependent methyltransferase [Silicimonas sp.]